MNRHDGSNFRLPVWVQYDWTFQGWKLVCALRAAVGEVIMSRSGVVRLLLVCSLVAALSTGCSRDPNVRKQKYFETGHRYFVTANHPQPAIPFSNPLQFYPRSSQPHN